MDVRTLQILDMILPESRFSAAALVERRESPKHLNPSSAGGKTGGLLVRIADVKPGEYELTVPDTFNVPPGLRRRCI
jgi:hypothetical protein